MSNRKCNALNPAQADALFFGGRGSKPTRAGKYCKGCPVISLCIRDAAEQGLEGFWGGTTKDQRIAMFGFEDSLEIVDEVEVEKEKKKPGRRPPQKRKTPTDTYEYLLTVNPPQFLY